MTGNPNIAPEHTEQSEVDTLFTTIIAKHKDNLEKWAMAQTKNAEKARELLQEIYIKIFLLTSKEYTKNNDIKSIDNYFWSIAWNTLKRINKKDSNDNIDSIDSPYFEYFKQNLPYIEPTFSDDDPVIDKTAQHTRLRQFILRLDYLEREITIMYYWDKMTSKEIADKLMLTGHTVNNSLVRIRSKLQSMLRFDSTNIKDVARPKMLYISRFRGFLQDSDAHNINNDAIKQNICLACFITPKSIEELLDLLNVSRPYLEPELQWLIDKGYLAKVKNEYHTQFFIFTADVYKEVFRACAKSKAKSIDILVGKLVYRRQKIKSIGFQGADRSIKQLLWFLVPELIRYIITRQYKVKSENNMPIGYEYLSDIDAQRLLLDEKYSHMTPWDKIGYYTHEDDIIGLGLLQRRFTDNSELPYNIIESGGKYHDIFVRIFTKKSSYNDLWSSDREALENMIRWGFLVYDDAGNIVPQFCVFTEQQRKALYDIFQDICSELQGGLAGFNKIMKICDSYVDKKMSELLFIASNVYISTAMRFAFFDGLLYKPSDEREFAWLSMMVTVKEIRN